MLLELHIQNFVIFESLSVPFSHGLNVLTGETGSGKSAIMGALRLIGGEKADTDCIRHGCSKASIEALFSPPKAELAHLLEESGIEYVEEEPLLIRREIGSSGKGKIYLNHQPILLSLLKTIAPYLFEMVTQHANQLLFSTDAHRHIVDTFGEITSLAKAYAQCWDVEKQLIEDQEKLRLQNSERERLISRYESEVEELKSAKLVEGEEEELFSEYTKLTNADELASLLDQIDEELTGDNQPIIPALTRHQSMLEKLAHLDPSCSEFTAAYKNIVSELKEASYSLRKYRSGVDHNPAQAAALNDRLVTITKMKRKYGPTVAEAAAYLKKAEEQLALLQGADERLETLEKEIVAACKKTNSAAHALTQARLKAAASLGTALTQEIRSLNMPKAELRVSVSATKRSRKGDDHVEIFMRPNIGEKEISVKECASGGEISRLLLSLKTLLAGLQATPCLIFDEIDANIGGETATIVGEKLHRIAQNQQLLCITHFPQVADYADHHLQVSKNEWMDRTVGSVAVLDAAGRLRERERMLGKISSTSKVI